MSESKTDEQKPVPYPAPMLISFTIPEPSSDDLKLIIILEQAINRYDHLSSDRLSAIVDWFSGYAESMIRELEIGAKAPK